ncbi:MAG: DUF1572 domain-containing protein [Acidobacteria bacterium]|nr:MAG: DUF1572 domain-containing protein [Acidobacteriota bacterium]
MKKPQDNLTRVLLKEAGRVLVKIYPRRIIRCLELLSEEEIWWRPNSASNSVGNVVLHLQGNVRQWIIAGLGGEADRRDRDREFAETGPIPRRILLAGMRRTIKEAQVVLADIIPQDLLDIYFIQGYRVTGLQAVCHVAEHFAFHTGQIIYVTKLKRGKDLKFTRLPAHRRASRGK